MRLDKKQILLFKYEFIRLFIFQFIFGLILILFGFYFIYRYAIYENFYILWILRFILPLFLILIGLYNVVSVISKYYFQDFKNGNLEYCYIENIEVGIIRNEADIALLNKNKIFNIPISKKVSNSKSNIFILGRFGYLNLIIDYKI